MHPEYAGYYPDWLGPELLWNDFPWEQGIATTMPDFLAAYTLHDSLWIALHVDPGHSAEAVLVLRWDAFWSGGRVPHPGSTVAEWPILLVCIRRLRGVRLDSFGGGWSPGPIGAAESVSTEGGVHLTELTGADGGRVLLEHSPEVTLLCLTPERHVLPIPGEKWSEAS